MDPLVAGFKDEDAKRAKLGQRKPVDLGREFHAKQARLARAIVERKKRWIEANCGRQSGKSHGCAGATNLVAAGAPNVNTLYVTKTFASCEKMAYRPACKLNAAWGLGGKPRAGRTLDIAFPNGSTSYYVGADTEGTIEKLRGTPNLALVVIDEAGLYDPEDLKLMIEAVTPGLRPLAGTLVVTGTPSRAGRQGLWYDITQNKRFDHHYFDYRDNDRVASFAAVEQLIDEELAMMFPGMPAGEHRQTAYFKREYLAEFVVDLAEQVYQLTDANLVDEIPEDHEVYATGGDIGVSANDALVSAGWSGDARAVYIVDQEEESGQDSTACADMVNEHNERRHPLFIALDAGGLGSKTIRTVQALYPEVPAVEAEKPAIGVQVRAFNSLAAGGRLKVKRGSKLALELVGPTWVDGIVGGKIDEHGRHSDLVPSVRYLAVKLVAILPGLADAPPPPDERARRVGAALRKARKPTFDDETVRDEQEFEPGSPWG